MLGKARKTLRSEILSLVKKHRVVPIVAQGGSWLSQSTQQWILILLYMSMRRAYLAFPKLWSCVNKLSGRTSSIGQKQMRQQNDRGWKQISAGHLTIHYEAGDQKLSSTYSGKASMTNAEIGSGGSPIHWPLNPTSYYHTKCFTAGVVHKTTCHSQCLVKMSCYCEQPLKINENLIFKKGQQSFEIIDFFYQLFKNWKIMTHSQSRGSSPEHWKPACRRQTIYSLLQESIHQVYWAWWGPKNTCPRFPSKFRTPSKEWSIKINLGALLQFPSEITTTSLYPDIVISQSLMSLSSLLISTFSGKTKLKLPMSGMG